MAPIRPTKSSFVVKNVSNKTIKVLGRIPVKPGNEVDLFRGVAQLSEGAIIDALRAPSGSLYREVYVNKNLKILSQDLLTLNNLQVSLPNLNTSNPPIPGQVLSAGDEGQLEWIFGDMAARLQYDPPLIQDGDNIRLPKADAFTNGFLSKEDWVIFKGKSKGLRVWQYQDFSGPFTNPLRLSNFENGRELSFNPNLIVDGTAVVVDVKDNNSAPKLKSGLGGLFSDKASVTQHVRDTVFLNNTPSDNQKIRVYFLIILPDGVNVPIDYTPPTEFVRKTRIEYFDAIDVDSGGAKSIFGDKVFNNSIGIKDRLFVGHDISKAQLGVEGSISCDSIQVRHGAADGHMLTSNAIGETEWLPNPVVNPNPPMPFNGRMWVKTPEYLSFVYDGNREKWISTGEVFTVEGSRNATSCANTYMVGSDNIAHHVNSPVLPFDAVLTGLMATGELNQSWIAEVHLNHKLVKGSVLHVVNSDRASSMNLNIDFKAGDKVQLFASGSGISMPTVRAIFKRRA